MRHFKQVNVPARADIVDWNVFWKVLLGTGGIGGAIAVAAQFLNKGNTVT